MLVECTEDTTGFCVAACRICRFYDSGGRWNFVSGMLRLSELGVPIVCRLALEVKHATELNSSERTRVFDIFTENMHTLYV
jgi:hypothetical protein